MDIKRFKEIFKDSYQYETISIKAYSPVVDDYDYQQGYISRYFVQNASNLDSPIIEVNDESFIKLKNNFLYKCVQLDWKISGTSKEIKEANEKSIKLASKTLENIYLYLPYTLQFSKPN